MVKNVLQELYLSHPLFNLMRMYCGGISSWDSNIDEYQLVFINIDKTGLLWFGGFLKPIDSNLKF
jgi:hypothetical protein